MIEQGIQGISIAITLIALTYIVWWLVSFKYRYSYLHKYYKHIDPELYEQTTDKQWEFLDIERKRQEKLLCACTIWLLILAFYDHTTANNTVIHEIINSIQSFTERFIG